MSEQHATRVIDMELPDILMQLGNEADDLHDGISDATLDGLGDLFGEAAEEIQRLRQEIAEALYRNQEAEAEIERLRRGLRGVWEFAAVAATEDSYGKRAREAFFSLTEQVEDILQHRPEEPCATSPSG